MQIFKNKYMRNLVVLVVVLFFISEALENFSKGNLNVATLEMAASVAAIVLVFVKRKRDKNSKDQAEE